MANNTYRYQAHNTESYSEFLPFAIDRHYGVSAITIHPADRCFLLTMDTETANTLGKVIDDKALDFTITEEDTEATSELDEVRAQLKQAQADLEAANKKYENDKWRADYYSQKSEKLDRVTEQIKAIAVLLAAITPKD